MAEDRLAQNDVIHLASALWNILQRDYAPDLRSLMDNKLRPGIQLGTEARLEQLPNVGTEHNNSTMPQYLKQSDEAAQTSRMTLASFVEREFVPGHVALKGPSGRAHYKAMLKHVLKPQEVERMLSAGRKASRTLEAVPGWPYLSDVRLCDIRPDHVSRLMAAAETRGYSPNTVMNLRTIISAIFSHAKRERHFLGDNPVSCIRPPEVRKRSYILTLDQARRALGAMNYPEREMTLIAIFTGMNLAEILGLQWRHLNLAQIEMIYAGCRIAPRTITVRDQLYRGQLISVKKSRMRSLPIPPPLLPLLIRLKGRRRFTGPNDYVLVSRVGTPVNANNILARRLRPIAKWLGVPSLSYKAFREVRQISASTHGRQSQDVAALLLLADTDRSEGIRLNC